MHIPILTTSLRSNGGSRGAPRLLLVNCAWLPTRFLVTSNATPRRVCRLPRRFFPPPPPLKLSSSRKPDESGTDQLVHSPFDDDRGPHHDR